MARSVEELRRESERSREALTSTVDQLRERLSDTAEDLRQKVSPQHIKSEVSSYIGHKTQDWLGALKQRAMDNPMQAVATGTAVAVPVLRLARGVPLPLLMIAAGLALTSKTVRGRAAEAVAPAADKAGEVLSQTAEHGQALVGNIRDTVSSAQGRAGDLTTDAQNRVGNLADDLRTRVAETASTVTDTIEAAQNSAAAAPEQARRVIGENAAVIGGLGVAIGAIIAAALPKTEAEVDIMGGASSRVKEAATEATHSGFEAVKERTMSAADAAEKSVADADLGAQATRMTRNMADSLKEAGEDVVTAAFDPSRTPNA
ncbi:MAG: DUF3618 domain-containing protein [Bradyrhizobium sp.]|uniref:DUF3618 domain-containing protein n=1 Tax=Bradyrhizobium sp. TaxID=376 RepID=UPI001C28AD8B|nr:DUF3618 domain-containing protein [Bradyrhizobium sp.]MBU6463582.1 DUF3618 domain-containing protein [Pseudomonadota bacterium]MDE2067032.1 DUF3618 domain-containing protein [Bradyrhizobium sp.]MDE2241238.1 DUF3618 domain-containing protein [Bradyrhizobium sp.]MDE2470765.1 DUF3618 domain-containing protein [Bradyrhizobium sp.]